MINWPETLVDELLGQRCVLFIGAGISADSKDVNGKSPPTWKAFLDLAVTLVKDTGARAGIEELLRERKFLIALQGIKEHSDRAAYSKLLGAQFNGQYKANILHETIFQLDAKMVITTNFDKIYESYCNSFQGGSSAYKTITYRQDDFADEIRSDTRLIVKAHGTIDAVREMIFTRAEYHEAKRKFSAFYDVLKAVFLTNTIVFMGCGLDDPDIALLLEDVNIAGRSQKPHYALVLDGGKNRFVVDDWQQTYNIKVLSYGPEHADLAEDLKNLLEAVNEKKANLISGPS